MLLRDYFNLFNLYKNGELSRNQIDRRGVRVKKENEKFTVLCSHSPQNLKFGNFTLLFCRGRQRNVAKFKTHLQSDCFSSIKLLFCCVVVAVAVVVMYVDANVVVVVRQVITTMFYFIVGSLHQRAGID